MTPLETHRRNGLQPQGLYDGYDQSASLRTSAGWTGRNWNNGGECGNSGDIRSSSKAVQPNNYVFPATPLRPRHPIFRFPSGQPNQPPFPIPTLPPYRLPAKRPVTSAEPAPSMPPVKPLPSVVKPQKDLHLTDECDSCDSIMLPYSAIFYPCGTQGPAVCTCPYIPLMNGCAHRAEEEGIRW